MNLVTDYPTKASLLEALAKGVPTAIYTAGYNPWFTGPVTIEGPHTPALARVYSTWTATAVVENCFIVPGSVK